MIQNVYYRYLPEGDWVLKDIDLKIKKGSTIGLVGTTGSGKSTLLDLLMGLLEPEQGVVAIDGKTLSSKDIRSWQNHIAHVPQQIYLSDTSIAENIAFGISLDQIDRNQVKKAAKKAQIADFIEGLEKQYETHVGERGVQLSGGQRQRIGIARALYKEANVLILDEATSALDVATESLVIDAIHSMDEDITIIMIAHRLATVRRCDSLILLEHGEVISQGSYDELMQKSERFRAISGEIPH